MLRRSSVRYTKCIKIDLKQFKSLLASDTEDWKIYAQDMKASIQYKKAMTTGREIKQ